MLHWFHRLLLLVALATVAPLAPVATGQERAPALDQARARWERMSVEERGRIKQRFDEFRGLPEAERERVTAHLSRVAQTRREIEARIPDEMRAKLDQLDPHQRHEVLREYVESTMGERADRLREKMSPELLAKLQSASPAEREVLLRGRSDELRERCAPRAIKYLGRRLELPPEEVARLEGLPGPEQLAAVEELGRRELQRRGPPPGVGAQEFRGWQELPPPEFMDRMHRHGMRGFRDDIGGPPMDRDQRGDGGRHEGRPESGPEGWPGERGPRPGDGPGGPPRGPRRESKLAPDVHRQVQRAGRPDPLWIVDLAHLPPEERRAEMMERSHARILDVLRAQKEVTAEELTALEALRGREFFEAVRDVIGDPPQEFGDRRRRDGPRDGPPEGPPPGGPPPPWRD